MSLIRKNLSSILDGFTKPLADLQSFIEQEQKQITIHDNNIAKLEQMVQDQNEKRSASITNIEYAKVYKSKLEDFLEAPVLGSKV